VERTSRFTAIVPLPFGRTADQVRTALIESVKDLPAQLVKSLTEEVAYSIDITKSNLPQWDRNPERLRAVASALSA
jgi:IS30 family transposase